TPTPTTIPTTTATTRWTAGNSGAAATAATNKGRRGRTTQASSATTTTIAQADHDASGARLLRDRAPARRPARTLPKHRSGAVRLVTDSQFIGEGIARLRIRRWRRSLLRQLCRERFHMAGLRRRERRGVNRRVHRDAGETACSV